MTDEELRQLVREALTRHRRDEAPRGLMPAEALSHPSHGRLPVATGGDGSCLIEPAVRCVHCGYCQSYGH